MIVGFCSEDVNPGLPKQGAEAPNAQQQHSFYYTVINKIMCSEFQGFRIHILSGALTILNAMFWCLQELHTGHFTKDKSSALLLQYTALFDTYSHSFDTAS